MMTTYYMTKVYPQSQHLREEKHTYSFLHDTETKNVVIRRFVNGIESDMPSRTQNGDLIRHDGTATSINLARQFWNELAVDYGYHRDFSPTLNTQYTAT